MKIEQFPIVCANARTIHKLQGRSIDNLVINNWDYTDNWIYVAVSRVRELRGLYIFRELEHRKCRGMSMEVKTFTFTKETSTGHVVVGNSKNIVLFYVT